MVGYSRVKKKELTSAVSSVKPEDLNISSVTNIGQMLQGRVAGLYVNSANQDPGATPTFLLRGASSLQEGAGQPLIVIDGFPNEDNSILNTINPNDIAQIDVLKGTAAAAIYGARGANGVIIVTTKTGSSSTIQVDYGVKISTQVVARTVDMMDADQYARFYLDLANDPNLSGGFGPSDAPHEFSEIGNFSSNTDWQKEVISTNNFVQDHNLSVSGAAAGVNYRFSTGYYSGDAVVGPADYERFNVGGKLNFVGKKFSLSTDFNFSSETNNDIKNSYNDALVFSPTSPVYEESGELGVHSSSELAFVNNPLFNQAAGENFTETNTTRIKLAASYEILEGLRLEVSGGLTQRNLETFQQRTKASFAAQRTTAGFAQYRNQRTLYADYFLKYNKTIDKHSFSVTGGGTYYAYNTRSVTVSAEEFPLVDIAYYDINAGLLDRTMASDWTEKKTVSGLVRFNYDFDKKYLLSSSYRIDGASQFGENQKWGAFPSVSAAYRIDKEDFFKDNVTALKTLKLRVGYGSAGNDNIPSFRSQGLYEFIPVALGNANKPGIRNVGTYKANPDIHWEEATTFNVGLEFGNNIFYAELDAYNKRSDELLLDRNLPSESGYNFITVNKGLLENKGIEGKVNFYLKFLDGKLRWSPGVWFSMNKNKILDFNDDVVEYGGGNWIERKNYGNTGIRKEGYSINAQWGYDFTGIWQQDEATEAAVFGAVPGDAKFADLNEDNQITDEDIQYLGDTNPIYTGGFSSKLNYGKFEFSFFIEGVFDKLVVNNNKISQMFPTIKWGRNLGVEALDRWTPSNPSNEVPSLTTSPTNNIVRSDWAMQDASFIRLRDVTFSYQVDVDKSAAFKSLRVYCSASNIFTITDYTGLNPDIFGTDNEFNLQPYSRTFTLGLNASF
jgi:TonB-linked SusC/RagA family outer membrane protein